MSCFCCNLANVAAYAQVHHHFKYLSPAWRVPFRFTIMQFLPAGLAGRRRSAAPCLQHFECHVQDASFCREVGILARCLVRAVCVAPAACGMRVFLFRPARGVVRQPRRLAAVPPPAAAAAGSSDRLERAALPLMKKKQQRRERELSGLRASLLDRRRAPVAAPPKARSARQGGRSGADPRMPRSGGQCLCIFFCVLYFLSAGPFQARICRCLSGQVLPHASS